MAAVTDLPFSLLDIMTEDQKDALVSMMISLKFKKGENILNEGDLASSFYIVQEGTVAILQDGKEIRQMSKGASFGEQALYYNTVRSATVKAVTDVNINLSTRVMYNLTLYTVQMHLAQPRNLHQNPGFSYRSHYFEKSTNLDL